MDREAIAWAAGLFEGEGCFYVNHIKKSPYKDQYYPCANVTITEGDVLERFRSIVGFGSIWKKVEKRRITKVKYWRCHGFERTQVVAAMLWPWLSPNRREQYAAVVKRQTQQSQTLPPQ